MRADRLLSLMLLLQTQGRMTAEQLATELEVSERTIYRDIDALSAAGVPVYAERGPGGGCDLLESYRTTLTGFTDDELQTLFMLNIPAPLAELGVSEALKTALLKLSAALPTPRQHEGDRVRQRIHLDSASQTQDVAPTPHLQTIHRAIWQNHLIRLTYALPFGTHIKQVVAPYGLVAKANNWYLIFAREGCTRARSVSQVVAVDVLVESFEHPVDFDLKNFWEEWQATYENQPPYLVKVRVAPKMIPYLPQLFGDPIRDEMDQTGPPDEAGWITLTLPFKYLEDARTRILGLGGAVEVIEPQALRKSVADYARQVAALYDQEMD